MGGRRIADRIAAGAAVIDVVTTALSADDVVVARAGIDDVVAASGMDRVRAIAGNDEVRPSPVVTWALPVPLSVTVVGTSYGIVKLRSSLVLTVMSTDAGADANLMVSPGRVACWAASFAVAKPP